MTIIKTFSKVNKVSVPFSFYNRRQGDISVCYADPKKAEAILGWSAKYNLEEICRDAWEGALKRFRK